ncbi:MAG: phospholipase [Hyphomicrobiaceae bacterium]|nr:phospholipase [Hyphomicrobiaceae bacterium]
MADRNVEIFATILPPLLQALEALALLARHLHPPDAAEVLEALARPEEPLRFVKDVVAELPEPLAAVRSRLKVATEATLQAYDGLHAALAGDGDLRAVMRALRGGLIAQEALYPLSPAFPVVSAFFLPEASRDDEALAAAAAKPAQAGVTGLVRGGEAAAERGGHALYVPETYTPDRRYPLVVALHGGSGNGRSFLWSWLRDARAHGAILLAPTAAGATWALTGDDVDSPRLAALVTEVSRTWSIDPARVLLTGLSDGGTFCYVSGLLPGAPFTHLAPVAASFHPVLATMADRARIETVPIFITHGSLDWMFPVEVARGAEAALKRAGARVVLREIEDLSHCYPREINAEILAWLRQGPAPDA